MEKILRSGEPCAIAKLGSIERAISSHWFKNQRNGFASFLPWHKEAGCYNAGVFPPTDEVLSRFSQELLALLPRMDALAAWNFSDAREQELLDHFAPDATLVGLNVLGGSPNYSWVTCLRHKKVLVIHPFSKTIRKQYPKKDLIYPNNPLPEFNLLTITAIQGLNPAVRMQYGSWFHALRVMCDQIDAADFDIALIGAGAFGIFLTDYVKSRGKQAVHVGGALQILFGVRGSRWDKYNIYNEHWVLPAPQETLPDLSQFLKHEPTKAYW